MGCLKLHTETTPITMKVVWESSVVGSKCAQCFMSVDPLASDYPNTSPYNYVLGNPEKFIDLDGRDIISYVYRRMNNNGEWVGQRGMFSINTLRMLSDMVQTKSGREFLANFSKAGQTDDGILTSLSSADHYVMYPSALMTLGKYTYNNHYYVGSDRVASTMHYEDYVPGGPPQPLAPPNLQERNELSQVLMNQRKQLNDIYLKQGLSPLTYTDSLEELTVGARDAQSEDECEAYILLWQLSLEDEDNISCLKDM